CARGPYGNAMDYW
nr:immunoglobulin heavy chain junction region [Mus musculus]